MNSSCFEKYKKNVENRYITDTLCFRQYEINELSWVKISAIFLNEKISTLTSFFFYLKWLNENNYKLDEDYIIFLKNNEEYFDTSKNKKRFDLRFLTEYKELKHFYIRTNAKKELKVLYLPYKSEKLLDKVLSFSRKKDIIERNYFDTFANLENAIGFVIEDDNFVSDSIIDKIMKYCQNKNYIISRSRLCEIFDKEDDSLEPLFKEFIKQNKNYSITVTNELKSHLLNTLSNWNFLRELLPRFPLHEINSFFYVLVYHYIKTGWCPLYLKKFFDNNLWAFDFEKERFRIDLRVLAKYDNIDNFYITKVGNASGLKLVNLPYKSKDLKAQTLTFLKEYVSAIKPIYFKMLEQFENATLTLDPDPVQWTIFDFKNVINYYATNKIEYSEILIIRIFIFLGSEDLKTKNSFITGVKVFPTKFHEYGLAYITKKYLDVPKEDKVFLIDSTEDMKKYTSARRHLRTINFEKIINSKLRNVLKEVIFKTQELSISEVDSFFKETKVIDFFNKHNFITQEIIESLNNTSLSDKNIFIIRKIASQLSKYGFAEKGLEKIYIKKKRYCSKINISTDEVVQNLNILKESKINKFVILYYFLKIIYLTKFRPGSLIFLNTDDIYKKGKQYYMRLSTKTYDYQEFPINIYVYNIFCEVINYTALYRCKTPINFQKRVFIIENYNRASPIEYDDVILQAKKTFKNWNITPTMLRKRAITNDNEKLEILTGYNSYNQALDLTHTPNSNVVKYHYTINKENNEAKWFNKIIGNFTENGDLIIDSSTCEELPKIQDCFLCPYFHPDCNGKEKIKALNNDLKAISKVCKNEFELKCLKNIIKRLDDKEVIE